MSETLRESRISDFRDALTDIDLGRGAIAWRLEETLDSHELLRAVLAAHTAECHALSAQLTEEREARQRERERHKAKMIEVMNERNEAREEHYREIIGNYILDSLTDLSYS